MATYNWGLDRTFKAAVSLASYQYYAVQAGSTAGEVIYTACHAQRALGILQNDPAAGEAATVRVFGFSKAVGHCEAADASPIVAGCLIKASSTSQVCGMLNPAASTWSIGYAVDALASGSGVYVQVFVNPERQA